MVPSLLFIPDISGFTRFVNQTEVAHSRHVIAELLDLIIESDELGMTVSELEGDAVFFYREGPLPDFKALAAQARRTFEAFHTHLKSYETNRICDCGACRSAHGLSLKIVAHSGPIELISVRDFQKPYGPDVIVAHRLLKNPVPGTEYLLVTDQTVGGEGCAPDSPGWSSVISDVATIEDLGDVNFHYVSLSPLKEGIPDPPPPQRFERTRNPIQAEVHVERDPAELFELISNFDLRLQWNRGVDDIEYESNRVNRVGTKHRCVVGGEVIEFETIADDYGVGRRVYGEHIPHNPLVDDFACYYIVTPDGSGARLNLELHYRPKAFPKNLLAPLFRFRFGRLAPGILNAIKEAAAEGRVESVSTESTAV